MSANMVSMEKSIISLLERSRHNEYLHIRNILNQINKMKERDKLLFIIENDLGNNFVSKYPLISHLSIMFHSLPEKYKKYIKAQEEKNFKWKKEKFPGKVIPLVRRNIWENISSFLLYLFLWS